MSAPLMVCLLRCVAQKNTRHSYAGPFSGDLSAVADGSLTEPHKLKCHRDTPHRWMNHRAQVNLVNKSLMTFAELWVTTFRRRTADLEIGRQKVL